MQYNDRLIEFILNVIDFSKIKQISYQLKVNKFEDITLYDYCVNITKDILPEKCTITERLFFVVNKLECIPKCSICGNSNNFIDYRRGYRKFCSKKCAAISEQTISTRTSTVIEKYGCDNVSKSDIIKDKIKKTNLERYGCEVSSKNEQVKKKSIETNRIKYGCDHIMQCKSVMDKRKKTCISKYGTEYAVKNSIVKNKIEATNISKYGCKYVFGSNEIKSKIKNTNIAKYGCSNVFGSKDIIDKSKNTMLSKYGVTHNTKSINVIENRRSNNIKKYGCDSPSQLQSVKNKTSNTCIKKYGKRSVGNVKEIRDKIIETRHKNFFESLVSSDRLCNLVKPMFTIDEYSGVNSEYSWLCMKCNNVFTDNIADGKIPRCNICNNLVGESLGEIELYEFVKQYLPDTIKNDRTILSGKELDIYTPSKMVAIEFDGLYWHSEFNGRKNKNYHLDKTNECLSKNIQLIHVFEDEWLDKKEIVKSIISSKLGVITNRIFARNCKINNVPSIDAKSFLDSNHIQGFINGKQLGLYYKDKLVSIITYGKPRFNKRYDIEILRFCNELNTVVVGGLSKLLSHIGKGSIISYADRRYSSGNSYLKCGFTNIGESKPSYYYIEGLRRYNRINFQKHKLCDKLNIYDENVTEWENMLNNGYDRIWDCGNYIYTK